MGTMKTLAEYLYVPFALVLIIQWDFICYSCLGPLATHLLYICELWML